MYRISAFLCAHVYIYTYAYIHTYIYECIHTTRRQAYHRAPAFVSNIYIYIHTHIHIYIVYIHTCTHTHTTHRRVNRRPPAPIPIRQLYIHTHTYILHTGELIVGLLLLYQFRQFERHWGSRRYGSYVLLTTTLHASLSLSALSLLQHPQISSLLQSYFPGTRISWIPGGPYGLIFASLVQYFYEIPVSVPMNVMGLTLSDKTISYIMAMQVCLYVYAFFSVYMYVCMYVCVYCGSE
jgi:hypothetical protein